MSSKAIVKIGYTQAFLAPTPAVAAKLVELLSRCVQVEEGDRHWYPTEDTPERRVQRIELILIPADQVRLRIPKGRRLGYTPPLPNQAGA